jgi:hypothetical protein
VDPQYEYWIAATIEDWQNEGNHVFSFFVQENCDEVKQSVLGTEMVDTTVTQGGERELSPRERLFWAYQGWGMGAVLPDVASSHATFNELKTVKRSVFFSHGTHKTVEWIK